MVDFIAIDIGNTTIEIAFFKNDEIIKKIFVKSKPIDFDLLKNKIIENSQLDIMNKIVVISSVVPSNNQYVKEFLENNFNSKVYILNALDYDLLVKVEKRNLSSVGMDIVCKSAWAIDVLKKDVLILDVGTATVLQYITKGLLHKVAITIGFNTIYSALNGATSLLPMLVPQKTDNLFGENTIEAIYGGTYWGYIGLIKEWINKAKKELGDVPIYITGGLSDIVKEDLSKDIIQNKDIVFYGINTIYKKNKNIIKEY